MGTIKFISVVFDSPRSKTPEGFLEVFSQRPSKKQPVSYLASEIKGMQPSVYSDEWTDVLFKDGDIVIADAPFTELNLQWEISLGFHPDET